jgi:hypothetical protein
VACQDIGFTDSIIPKESIGGLGIRPVLHAHGVDEPTRLDNCSSSCRSRLPWRASGNSHPINSLSIHPSAPAASKARLRWLTRNTCLPLMALSAPSNHLRRKYRT